MVETFMKLSVVWLTSKYNQCDEPIAKATHSIHFQLWLGYEAQGRPSLSRRKLHRQFSTLGNFLSANHIMWKLLSRSNKLTRGIVVQYPLAYRKPGFASGKLLLLGGVDHRRLHARQSRGRDWSLWSICNPL